MTMIAALPAVTVTGCADRRPVPYNQLSVGHAAAEQGAAIAQASAVAVLCSAVMRVLHCGLTDGHARG
jgi:hypothetical protein